MMIKTLKPAAFAAGFLIWGIAAANTSLEPRTAEIMPKAAKWIVNDIAKAPNGFVSVGDRGHVLLSSDGSTWQQVTTPVQAMLNRVRVFENGYWVVGHDGTILHSSDQGQSWSMNYSDTGWGKPFYDILFLDDQNGFVIGANSALMQTMDGGASWEMLEPDFTMHGLHLNTILQLADGTIVIGGEKGMMIRSLDNGETWQHVQTPYAGSFFGMMPYGPTGVFVFGLRGNVYSAGDIKLLDEQDTMEWDEFSLETVTDNAELGGIGWHYYQNDLKESLFGGTVLGPNDVLLVGVNGAVVRTRDGHMETLKTGIEHTLGSAVVADDALITVGFSGIQNVPFGP